MCSLIPSSFATSLTDLPCDTRTSACRNLLIICSGVYLILGISAPPELSREIHYNAGSEIGGQVTLYVERRIVLRELSGEFLDVVLIAVDGHGSRIGEGARPVKGHCKGHLEHIRDRVECYSQIRAETQVKGAAT